MTDDDIRQLADAIFRDKVLAARAMSPEEKLLAGPRLFERSCRIMKEGIRHDFPDADEEQVDLILEKRLNIVRRLEKAI